MEIQKCLNHSVHISKMAILLEFFKYLLPNQTLNQTESLVGGIWATWKFKFAKTRFDIQDGHPGIYLEILQTTSPGSAVAQW